MKLANSTHVCAPFLRAVPSCLLHGALAGVLLATHASAQDLRIVSIDDSGVTGDWQTLSIGGSLSVEIENADATAIAGSFDVVAWSDDNPNALYDAGLDTLLGAVTVSGIAGSTQQSVPIALSGYVRFRDDRIFVRVDEPDAISELDEANNQLDTSSACTINIPPGAINPVIQWAWTSTAVEPASLNVMMTPAIIDVNGDLVPDVIFGTTESQSGGYVEVGILRALDGATGAELWNVTDPQYLIDTAFNVAAGDIDGDGLPEIIGADETGVQLICFEHDGTFKWRTDPLENQYWGGVSLADLDHDGTPEIVSGRQVLDANGTLLWTGTGGSSQTDSGPLSIVADVDLDGSPDIVAGNTVYRADGSILCDDPSLPDGYNAVADFDGDAYPEIVLVAQGFVYLLEQDQSAPASLIQLWAVQNPLGLRGGAPTIADYDGDGLPEIGVADAATYTVYEHDGTVKWEVFINDSSSQATGSSVFDFNGDGSAEVIYRDQTKLYIFEGATGNVLFDMDMSSCTWHEYPLVADVDADGNAELVVGANNNCSQGPQQGMYVFRDADDNWVSTRRIWNQHSYHITNVNDDGTIPAYEDASWLYPSGSPFNSYRQNQLAAVAANAGPDLSASLLDGVPAGTPDTAVVRVGNGGATLVGAGIPVAFYDADPNLGGVLLGVAYTSFPLAPGDFEDVSLFVGTLPSVVWAQADDTGSNSGTENECDETNNLHSTLVVAPDPAPFCYGDGSLGTPCPCGNTGDAGHGCGNSVFTGGALLTVTGGSDPDTIDFTTSDVPPGVAMIYLQGDALIPNGVVFGDGIRCAGGFLTRLGLVIDTDQDSTTSFGPSSGDGQISVLGSVSYGVPYYYQTYYRNPNPSWCPPATFNSTNAIEITWL